MADSSNNEIRYVNKQSGNITTVAGRVFFSGSSGDNGPATSASLSNPNGLSLDTIHNLLYIADTSNSKIRMVTLSSGIITTYAGTDTSGSSGDGGAATSAQLNYPRCTANDPFGNLYIVDSSNNKIRKVNSAGIIFTFAGGGMSSGDGLQATSVLISSPNGVAADRFGNVYISDASHYKIR